jgi:hypothetical protein
LAGERTGGIASSWRPNFSSDQLPTSVAVFE